MLKYIVNVSDVNSTTGATINVPISMKFDTTDQAEIIERDFVVKEMENAINPIVDYEKIRFTPVNSTNDQINQIIYNLNLLDTNGNMPLVTTYATEDFDYNDLKFRKNKFKRSFIRLSFFDSDSPTDQNLVSFMTLFCRLRISDLIPVSTIIGVPNPQTNLPKQLNQIPIRFSVENPLTQPNGISEGYYLYHFKNDVQINLPKELYMRASWNNAKTGKSVPLITSNVPQTIDNLVDKLHTKYILKRTNDAWYYEIDSTYNAPNNVTVVGNLITVNLYEIQVL